MTEKPKPRGKQPITTVRRWQIPRNPNPNVKYRYEPIKGSSYRITLPPE